MTAALATAAAQEKTDRPAAEVDLWWGSYAGRDMVPSFAVCVGLTVLIYFGARWWVPERGWLQLTVFGAAGAVWLVQLGRWCHRFFTWNYRVTSLFLYIDCGLFPLVSQRHDLRTIERVEVRQNGLAKWLGIADLAVWFDQAKQPPAVMKAVTGARAAADLIRDAVTKAREDKT